MAASNILPIISLFLGEARDTNEAIIRIGFFALFFVIFSRGTKRVFPENPPSIVIAAILSLISVRLIPLLWLLLLGKFLLVFAVVLLPYIFVDKIVHRWSATKFLLLFAIYFGVYLLLSGFEFSFFINRYLSYRWQSVIAISLLVLYIVWQFASRSKSSKKI